MSQVRIFSCTCDTFCLLWPISVAGGGKNTDLRRKNVYGGTEIPSACGRRYLWGLLKEDQTNIHSPGNLPAGMTVESMVAGVSMPRNDLLFNNAIYLLPYTGAGSGLRRAMDTGVEVQFDDNEKTREFVIAIPRREHHVKNAPSNREMHHENAPSSAKTHQEGGEMHQENAPSSEKTHQLTKKQIDIINFCSIPRSSKEIMARLGLYNQSRNRQRHIQPLIDMGYLETTIQGNPKAKGQKYRKTSKKI